MLIEFSIGNFRSFKETVTLSLLAAKLRSKNKELDECNVFQLDDSFGLLKSAAVYGANASGKSNLIRAMAFMKKFVLESSKDTQATEKIKIDTYRLSTETENKPAYFEMIFYQNEIRYRYGFAVDREKIHAEWLYHVPGKRETKLFLREDNEFELAGAFKEGKGLENRTRSNALFLSVVAQFNGETSQSILSWFKKLGIISGLDDIGYRDATLEMLNNEVLRKGIISLIGHLDVGISDITVETKEFSESVLSTGILEAWQQFFPDVTATATVTTISTLHKKYGLESQEISSELFDIESHESEGTQKVFFLTGPLLHTLQSGRVLIIDELDARLHPLITVAIVKLFNSKTTNSNNAQLIFTTHDSNLLSNKYFRRDQIWFTEKDKYGATALYSLAEYKIRNDASFEKDYISGKYGAIPFLGNLESFLVEHIDG